MTLQLPAARVPASGGTAPDKRIVGRHAVRLADCALIMARAFARGSRLLILDDTEGRDAARAVRGFTAPAAQGPPLPAFRDTAAARPGDVTLALFTRASTSDMVFPLALLRWKSMFTVAFAGPSGSRLTDLHLADQVFLLPSGPPDRLREAQGALCYVLRDFLWQASHFLATSPDASNGQSRPRRRAARKDTRPSASKKTRSGASKETRSGTSKETRPGARRDTSP